MGKVVLDPVTRVEGHLRVETRVDGGRVTEARVAGEMFRGFEAILRGRDALDAPVITQRICGVCPVSHAVASCRALEEALGLSPPPNGRLLRSLVLGANFLQSHILHFYQLSILDYLDVTAVLGYRGPDPGLRALRAWAESEIRSGRILPGAPFLPQWSQGLPDDPRWSSGALAHYLEALEARQAAHRMAARFGGKLPHTATLVPGGVTSGVDPVEVEAFRSDLARVRSFVENAYLPDLAGLGRRFPDLARAGAGVGRYLSYGALEEADGSPWLPPGVILDGRLEPLDPSRVAEQVGFSRFRGSRALPPLAGETDPDPGKPGAYSWLKAPRYGGAAVEVGPAARVRVALAAGRADVEKAASRVLADAGLGPGALGSVLGRHLARGIEALLLARRMEAWLDALDPAGRSVGPYAPRPSGQGAGLVEAPRGALGHWVEVRETRIARYQCVVPSTWNFSPRGDRSDPGPVEAALEGLEVDGATAALAVARVVRSFDPCIACAVH